MLNRKMKPIAAAVGAAFAATMATNVVADEADPFEASLLDDGVILASSHKEGGCGGDKDKDKKSDDEAKCGEGKCGDHEHDDEAKCGEGKCGDHEHDDEAKCGEGKCGDHEHDDESEESGEAEGGDDAD